MITKEQAQALTPGDTLHYTGRQECHICVGPRGGRTERIVHVRVNGQTKTWKRSPKRFRVPVKYGLYEYAYLDETNNMDFHLPEDCQPTTVTTKNVRRP